MPVLYAATTLIRPAFRERGFRRIADNIWNGGLVLNQDRPGANFGEYSELPQVAGRPFNAGSPPVTTAINEEDTTASLDLAFQVASYFELKNVEARKIAAEVARGVANWRRKASRHGLSKAEIDRMASAFGHEDLKKATRR